MLRQSLFYFFIISLSLSSYAQTGTICHYKIVEFKKFEIKKPGDETHRYAVETLNKAREAALEFEFVLQFNDSVSSFQLVNQMNNDVNKPGVAAIGHAVIGKGKFYQNSKKGIWLKTSKTAGKKYTVQDSINFDWVVTKETKIINGFTCYKAELPENGTIEEVWFTPQITASFGPLGLCGLPGLIVEVKRGTFVLSLVEISTNEIVDIEKPDFGKLISAEKYNKMMDKIRSTIFDKN
ncbi:GLPGLI family protein [Zunongwangia endophytica]|uniref:GLPGLI family protein n=1 Tax=Zunongwangia endophytica TaxID=1808945 RepID=A0ABV8H7I3_9FLAO|nr:GLPGLI family protein [Zunongwangia endophytica]MDN3595795.1 GLPGLI family protein [Zunongwangia endophytica]